MDDEEIIKCKFVKFFDFVLENVDIILYVDVDVDDDVEDDLDFVLGCNEEEMVEVQ